MSDEKTTTRRTRPAPPTFLAQPASADLLLAVLAEHVGGIDRSTPIDAAVAATIDGFIGEIVDGGYGSGYDPRTTAGVVTSGRFPVRPESVGGTGG